MSAKRVHVYRETREERNKRIALEALTLLEKAAGGKAVSLELEELHRRWEARGVRWTRPTPLICDPDDWLTANDMAEYFDVTAEMVRRWHYRGRITSERSPDGTPLYNVGEVIAYRARRNRRPTARQQTCLLPESDASENRCGSAAGGTRPDR